MLKSNARNSHRMGGKLEKPWLGPYIINQDLGKGRYCLKTLEGKPLKQTIHCVRLKRFLDPVVEEEISLSNDEDIVNEVDELEISGSECGHEDEDNYKEPRFQNKHKKSHSREQHTILEPASLLEEQLYSSDILRLWRSGACTSHYEAKEDDDEFEVNSC